MAFLPGVPPLRGAKSNKAISPQSASSKLRNSKIEASTKSTTVATNAQKQPSSGKRKTRNKDSKGKGPTLYINPSFSDSDSSSSSSSEMNSKDTKRTIFYDDRKGSPVSFKHYIEPSYTVQNYQEPEASHATSSLNYNSRLCTNICSFSYHSPFGGGLYGGPITEHYRTLFARMERKVLKEIRSKIVDSFTYANFMQTISVTIDALEWYYTLDSILSYDGDSANRDKNKALILWQERFNDIDIYTRQNELRKLLETRCLPPKFFDMIRWTFQNYKTADLEQAEAYRFIPNQAFVWYVDMPDETWKGKFELAFDNILNKLRTPTTDDTKVNTILSMVDDSYIINSLPLSSNNLAVDGQHHQIFVNQPVWHNLEVAGESTHTCFPDHANEAGEPVMYCANENLGNANGFAFTLQDSYSSLGEDYRVAMLRTFSAATFHPTYDDWDSNKYDVEYRNNTLGFYPRLNYEYYPNTIGDIHNVKLNFATSGTVDHQVSAIQQGYQQVFFNPTLSPLIDVRQLIDNLWNLN